MCRSEDLEFDRFESRWDRRIEIWRNASLYETITAFVHLSELREEHARIWCCYRLIDLRFSRNMRCRSFTIRWNSDWRFESRWWSESIDNFWIRLRLLDVWYSSFLSLVMLLFLALSLTCDRARWSSEIEKWIRCHVENDRSDASIEWRFDECQYEIVVFRYIVNWRLTCHWDSRRTWLNDEWSSRCSDWTDILQSFCLNAESFLSQRRSL